MNNVEYIEVRKLPGIALRRTTFAALIIIILFIAGLVNLESAPPLWWDEGWTLMVARTWVEQGHYGRLLDGQLVPAGLSAAFPVTAPIALSFRLFGVGVWQGRMPGLLFTLGALIFIYQLARHLYSRQVAVGTLAVLLLMVGHPGLHTLYMSRQALAEMPMLFYLLGGYIAFLFALIKSSRYILYALLFWGLALTAKAQVLPFWLLSLIVPITTATFAQRWNLVGKLSTMLIGSLLLSRALTWGQALLLQSRAQTGEKITGLYNATALVFTPVTRLFALQVVLLYGIPTLLGVCYATWKWQKLREQFADDGAVKITQVSLLVLVSSWFGWYLLLSVGLMRYLFPAVFIGSMFLAALMNDLTHGYKFPVTLRHAALLVKWQRPRSQSVCALLALVLLSGTVPMALLSIRWMYVDNVDDSVFHVAHFLNVQTPPNALIESYESEIFFLLDRRYHYPPDQVHVALLRRTMLAEDAPVSYDPLLANPDYLVVGPFSRIRRLYDSTLINNSFRLVQSYGGYQIYQRVR